MTLATAPAPRAAAAPAVLRGLLRGTRPRQWVKNLLVLAAPGAAGVLLVPAVAARSVAAVACCTVASAGCYLLNDVRDRDRDRLHPRKRLRPVAAGTVPVRTATAVGLALVLLAPLPAAALSPATGVLLVCYVLLTVAYGLRLKDVPVVELALVANGFVLRTAIGAAAARVPLSVPFVVVVVGAAVHVAASKRSSELSVLGPGAAAHRDCLRSYTIAGLSAVRRVSGVLAALAYLDWGLQRPSPTGTALALVSAGPLCGVILVWMRRTEQGGTESPERVLLTDPAARALALAWLICFAGTVLVG